MGAKQEIDIQVEPYEQLQIVDETELDPELAAVDVNVVDEDDNSTEGLLVVIETPSGLNFVRRINNEGMVSILGCTAGDASIGVEAPGMLLVEQVPNTPGGLIPRLVVQWETGWTTFVALDVKGPPLLLRYNRESGGGSVMQLKPETIELEEVWSGAWASGWSSLVSYHRDDDSFLFVYNQGTGATKILRWTGADWEQTWSGQWTAGWTSIVLAKLAKVPYLLEYKQSNGSFVVDELKAGGAGVQERKRTSLPAQRTALAAVNLDKDRVIVAEYAAAGTVTGHLLGADFELTLAWKSERAPGVTPAGQVLVAGVALLGEHCPAADAKLPTLYVSRVEADDREDAYEQPCSKAWSVFTVLAHKDVAYWFEYQSDPVAEEGSA